jgi:hypothetical protein
MRSSPTATVSVSESPVGSRFKQGSLMPEYRAYILNPDGHIESFEPIVCNDDDAAIAHAKRLVDGLSSCGRQPHGEAAVASKSATLERTSDVT